MSRSTESKKNEWRTIDAQRYHAHTGGYADTIDRAVVSSLIEGHSGMALDLPCGSGRMSLLLRSKFTIVSADYSPTMLGFASRDPMFVGARVDAFQLGFADSSFDLIHCLRLSFHYPNFEEILAEFYRVLKPGGILLLDSLNPGTLRHLLAIPLIPIRGRESRRVHFRSKRELERLLKRYGFEVVRTESRYLLPTRIYQYLPRSIQNLLTGLERILPGWLRVLTYWKTIKRESDA